MRPRLTPRIGISTCLLGEEVRHDGGHKRDQLLMDTLGQCVEWVPVCPEVELGLGIPREPIQLVRGAGSSTQVRLQTIETGVDLTTRMRSFAGERVTALAEEHLSGYIFKAGSPSCGVEHVDVWHPNNTPEPVGRGLFAEELMRQFPDLPVEEEGRLYDPGVRERFIKRVFAYAESRASGQ